MLVSLCTENIHIVNHFIPLGTYICKFVCLFRAVLTVRSCQYDRLRFCCRRFLHEFSGTMPPDSISILLLFLSLAQFRIYGHYKECLGSEYHLHIRTASNKKISLGHHHHISYGYYCLILERVRDNYRKIYSLSPFYCHYYLFLAILPHRPYHSKNNRKSDLCGGYHMESFFVDR